MRAPNGTDPLPGISVYAAKKINPYPTPFCDLCAAPIDEMYASSSSLADGTFTLSLDNVPYGADIQFVVQVGRFRKITKVPVTACTSAALPAGAATLPGKSTDGEIPKIAVSSGTKDHLDAILTALGITEYDCYEGRKAAGASTATCAQVPNKKIPDVLSSAAALDAYHMVFLSCAPGAYASWGPAGGALLTSINTNVAAFAAAGGRMIATDTAYDYIEQAFPDAITFAGPTAAPGVAQAVDGANVGCSTGAASQYPVNVDDPALTAWLKVVGIPGAPSVNVAGFIQPWSVIASLPATTSLIADGPFGVDQPTCATTKDVPLTAQFDVNACGRVIYSSYHTLSALSNPNPGAQLTAQEKILEYMIFAVAGCHM